MMLYAIFHPATGYPDARYVIASDERILLLRVVAAVEIISRTRNGGGAWPREVASVLNRVYGYATAPRPRDPSVAKPVDVHLEHRMSDRPGGLGPIEDVLICEEVFLQALINAVKFLLEEDRRSSS